MADYFQILCCIDCTHIYFICYDLQLVIYQARMQQIEDTCTHLREELSRTKQECMQLQGMKQGLHQRLSEQQQEILQVGVFYPTRYV